MTSSAHKFGLSLEFFPPKSLDASFKLWNTVEVLADLEPDFVSVTYGANGSTRKLTKDAMGVIAKHYKLPIAGHLTCVGASKHDVLDMAKGYASIGSKNIVALRGDSEIKGEPFKPHADGFKSSIELIEALADLDIFNIRVAAYPHPHPEARTATSDIEILKAKFDAGADSAITQFFFEAEDFLRFRDLCQANGITKKIIPGILPIENWARTKVFSKACGIETSAWMDQAFSNASNYDEAKLLSTSICSELCDTLLSEGVEDLHFYTLNDPTLTHDICEALGRKPKIQALKIAG